MLQLAIDEFSFLGKATAHLKAVENTDKVHNLGSLYAYARVIHFRCWGWRRTGTRQQHIAPGLCVSREQVLKEFGVELSTDDIEVRVYDSTAELRYLVVPQRPPGNRKFFPRSNWQALVTRNSMIGTQRDLSFKGVD